MKAIFGLGNPGIDYEKARHNAGFIVLDTYAESKGLEWAVEGKFKGLVTKDGDLLLIKPQTFMNLSGSCVKAVSDFYKIPPEEILVVHDDVDLEFGRVKKQLGGSSAGHHGIEDIMEKLGTEKFWRLRIGLGRPEDKRFDVSDWVLNGFNDDELSQIKEIKLGDWF